MASSTDGESEKTTKLPSRLPASSGNIVHDSIESAKHVTDLPCARNALLAGIASGTGMGVIRGLSAGPMTAGHWAIATFTIISLGSWHICQQQFANERKQIAQVFETTMPKRTLKETSNASGSSPDTKA